MVKGCDLGGWLRILVVLFLVPFLLVEPFFSKVVLYTLPLFVLLTFTAEVGKGRSRSRQVNVYILITSLYLVGVSSGGSFIRAVIAAGLVMVIFMISVDTT